MRGEGSARPDPGMLQLHDQQVEHWGHQDATLFNSGYVFVCVVWLVYLSSD